MLWSLQAPHAAVMVKPTPCLIDGCPSTSTNKHTQYTLAYLPQYSMPPSINYPAGLETLLPLDRQWPAHHHHFHPSHPIHTTMCWLVALGLAVRLPACPSPSGMTRNTTLFRLVPAARSPSFGLTALSFHPDPFLR
ncbi:hypothetical protein CGCA056_v010843 [Colletotrichum aenigma]|uniref:uncharacterized protein n=1 Tax=Colletotrichum aenigma TaxID=1215731 RepID=UPI0018733294|nr:uncharacterized protein CGCA056_v010843 [Colletotrichum aenigma]KAF5518389.1 hypothetical protein CGCA056_v010843 [Colletotrichum aenigma]